VTLLFARQFYISLGSLPLGPFRNLEPIGRHTVEDRRLSWPFLVGKRSAPARSRSKLAYNPQLWTWS
jgi:hypothetical protein